MYPNKYYIDLSNQPGLRIVAHHLKERQNLATKLVVALEYNLTQ